MIWPSLTFMGFELSRTRNTMRRDQERKDFQLNGIVLVITGFEIAGRIKNHPTKHMSELTGMVTKKIARQE